MNTDIKTWYETKVGAATEVNSAPIADVYDGTASALRRAVHIIPESSKQADQAHMVTALAYALATFTADEESLLATTVDGRLVPVYCNMQETHDIAKLVATTRETLDGMLQHVAPYDEITTELGISPQVALLLEEVEVPAEVKIAIHVADGKLAVEWDAALHSEAIINQFIDCFLTVMDEFNTRSELKDVILTTAGQRAQLDSFNAGTLNTTVDDGETIVSLFKKTVTQYPDNVAVVFGDKRITYRELDEMTDRIASHITAPVVSIIIGRSENMIVCALAATKAGAVYQPLDPSYPQERLNFMVKDSKATLLIADRNLRELVNEFEGEVMFTDEFAGMTLNENTPQHDIKPEDAFILLYTSGSTGVPKGVILEHRNIVTFCNFYRRYMQLDPDSRLSAYASFGFDANMMDTYPALSAGSSVYIIPEDMRLNLDEINDYFAANGVTHAFFTTQVGQQFCIAYPEHPTLKHVSMGGEKMASIEPPVNYKMHNLYGPTECTIFVTICKVEKKEPNIPIGPSNDTAPCTIVNKYGQQVPAGAAGELIIHGAQVGRGYLNRPEKTAEVFGVFGPNSYRTGDIVRYREDSKIEFVGRKDGQVKIRGFRVELKEVEAIVREYPGIKDATIQAFDLESGGKYIAAYIVSDEQVDINALNNFILEQKPPYMVPAVTMQIDAIPLNVNQKVDKKKLPKPSDVQAQDTIADEAPHALNVLEQRLVDIVGKLVGNTSIPVATPLKLCGLSSILAMRLAVMLKKQFALTMTSKEILAGASILDIENAIMDQLLSGGMTAKENKAEEPAANVTCTPLTYAQQGVYIDCLRNADTTLYNIPVELDFPEGTDPDSIIAAIKATVEAHPSLSFTFDSIDGIPSQIFTPFDLNIEPKNIENSNWETFKQDFIRPFDLKEGPLARFEVATCDDQVRLLFDIHHLVADGMSIDLFINDLLKSIEGGEVEAEGMTYLQYALKQKADEQTPAFAQSKAFFAEQLKDFQNSTEIPADKNGEASDGNLAGVTVPVNFEAVNQYATRLGVTPAAVFLAATYYTAARFTNSKQVYLGTISNGRSNLDISNTTGMFVGTLPLASLIGDQKVDEYVKQCGENFALTLENENYPFLQISADYGFSPNLMYEYQRGVLEEYLLNGKKVEQQLLSLDKPRFKTTVKIEDEGVRVEYNDAFYNETTMLRLAQCISTVAERFAANTGTPVKNTSILTAEQDAELQSLRHTCMDDNAISFNLFHESVEHWAQETPDATALIATNETLTYKQFNEKANLLAHALISRGVEAHDRVCLLLPRRSWHMIAMFGVMKAGAAYIPCDPEYPAERINLITDDSHAKFVITTKDKMEPYGERALDVEALLAEDHPVSNPGVKIDSSSLAYLIYTSGSTGRPKGVMLHHRGICNYLTPHPENRHIYAFVNECKAMMGITTVSFDLSLKELGATLYNGKTLVLANEQEIMDPQMLADLYNRTGCDGFNGTPSRLKTFLELPAFQEVVSRLKVIILGGEKYPATLLPQLREISKARLFNTYGPTEITVSSNVGELTNSEAVTVGPPLLNYHEYVVDNDLNELPVGVVGELLIGGLAVGKGYNDLPEKTAEAFIEYNGMRCYKSGDYARWNPDGQVVILGRKDHQIKLNGLRIELGEVETVLNKQPQVKEGVVMIKNLEGHDHLVAYFTSPEADTDTTVLKQQMGKSLTHYMVPTIFVQLDKMPISPNGKTDLKALPEPSLGDREYVEPANDLERFFCDTFASVLEREQVGATDNFFEIGGTSLVAIRIVMAAMQAGHKIVYKNVFDCPTPRALATLLGAEAPADATAPKKKAAEATPGVIENNDDPEASNYDYTRINEVLSHNNAENFKMGELRALGTCIVTGATGFLGIHVVKELIERDDVDAIYCMVRSNKRQTADSRLRTQLFYYFGNTYAELMGTRVHIIDGDVTKPECLDVVPVNDIKGNITVINCAANVKHFSAGTDIEDINIGGCQTCIEFCLKHGARFIQTSTHSIAGNTVSDIPGQSHILTEDQLYWGQELNNQYTHSKFIAERNVLEAVAERGLDGKIVRLGNLSARSTDGEFQINFTSNSFMGRLRALQTVGCMPYSMCSGTVEFSPINEVARAVVLLATLPSEYTVFHPVCAQRQLFDNVIVCLNRLGINIKTVEDSVYQQALMDAMNDPTKAPILQSLMAYDASGDKYVVENSDNNSYTFQVLIRLGFRWNFTTWDYMEQFIKAIQELGFFDDDYQR
ncbi:MAG: amino acid adenylation domain-containing protein [Muribaculaceae bacterium]|nr:amino acid adenylation domain-containing protein [Muribaculaceae bacterium]